MHRISNGVNPKTGSKILYFLMNFQKFNLICVQFTIIENKLFEFLVFSLKTQNVNSRLEKKEVRASKHNFQTAQIEIRTTEV